MERNVKKNSNIWFYQNRFRIFIFLAALFHFILIYFGKYDTLDADGYNDNYEDDYESDDYDYYDEDERTIDLSYDQVIMSMLMPGRPA